MSLLDVARTRYTTKHYDPAKRVSDADFADLLEVLRLAPTSVNAQATRYFVADNAAAKEKILPAILDFNRPCHRIEPHDRLCGKGPHHRCRL